MYDSLKFLRLISNKIYRSTTVNRVLLFIIYK